MGFFLSKTWLFWLLAALLAALIAWLLCRWWAGRSGSQSSADAELVAAQGLLRTREADLKRLEAERATHLADLAALRPKALAHDSLTTELETLRAGSVSLPDHESRVAGLAADAGLVPGLRARIAELEGESGQVSGLRSRIAELEGESGQVSGLQARIAGLEPEAGLVPGLRARIAELEGERATATATATAVQPDVEAGARALGFSLALDDLTVVEGIGPKIAALCNEAGIHTWRQLAQTPVSRLQEILAAAGPRYQIHDPGTWPRQAALLADGHWEPFKSWTDQLKGGRPGE